METFKSYYYAGKGAVFLGDLDASNNPSNLVFVGDLTAADLTPQVERGSVIENVTGGNAVAAEWLKSVRYNFTGQLRSVKHNHLATALQAANTAKASATVTDEDHTANHDAFVALLHTKVSAVTVTGSGGSPTYAVTTDYIVHADEGMIEILSTGAITDLAAIEVDYTYADQHHLTTDPGSLNKCLVFAGMNTANDNKQMRCTIYQIKLDPSVLTLINDEAADMPLTGTVQLTSARPAGDQLFSWMSED